MNRLEVCEYIQSNWERIQQEAINRTTHAISCLTADQICERFLAAGEKYGEFDLHSIRVHEELQAEFADIPSYIVIEELQK